MTYTLTRRPSCCLVLLSLAGMSLASCSSDGDAYSPTSGVKLEDTQNKDMQFNSPLPAGSPDTPPSEISASPGSSSVGAPPIN